MTAGDRQRWTVACRDDAGNLRVLNVELTGHGAVRIIPSIVGTSVWTASELETLIVVLHTALARLRPGDA